MSSLFREPDVAHMHRGVARVVAQVAILNLAYFGLEFSVGLAIGSVSLLADSIHFLAGASINFMILIALGWRVRHRARISVVLAGIFLIPGLATFWTAWNKFLVFIPPAPLPLILTGTGAFIVNLVCVLMLARYGTHGASLTRTSLLSIRNDVLANAAIISAGFVTAYTMSHWPDLILGVGIFLMNSQAAR